MTTEVLTRCMVRGPADMIERFKAECFGVDEEGDLVMDFERIVPAPPIFERFENEDRKTDIYALLLLGAREGVATYQHPFLNLFLVRLTGDLSLLGSPLDPEVAKELFALHPEFEQIAWNTFDLAQRTGYASGLHWRRECWGAMSIGYGCDIISENPFEFHMVTAHGFPAPIFQKLAELYLQLSFDAACILEDHTGQGWFDERKDWPPFEIGKLTREIANKCAATRTSRSPLDSRR